MNKFKISLKPLILSLPIFFGMMQQSAFADKNFLGKFEKGIWEVSKDKERINGFICSTDKNIGFSNKNLRKYFSITNSDQDLGYLYSYGWNVNYFPVVKKLKDLNLLAGSSIIFATTKNKVSNIKNYDIVKDKTLLDKLISNPEIFKKGKSGNGYYFASETGDLFPVPLIDPKGKEIFWKSEKNQNMRPWTYSLIDKNQPRINYFIEESSYNRYAEKYEIKKKYPSDFYLPVKFKNSKNKRKKATIFVSSKTGEPSFIQSHEGVTLALINRDRNTDTRHIFRCGKGKFQFIKLNRYRLADFTYKTDREIKLRDETVRFGFNKLKNKEISLDYPELFTFEFLEIKAENLKKKKTKSEIAF